MVSAQQFSKSAREGEEDNPRYGIALSREGSDTLRPAKQQTSPSLQCKAGKHQHQQLHFTQENESAASLNAGAAEFPPAMLSAPSSRLVRELSQTESLGATDCRKVGPSAGTTCLLLLFPAPLLAAASARLDGLLASSDVKYV